MNETDWLQIHTHILQLEQEGLVTRTFRRLDPDRQGAVLTAILDEAAARGPAALNIKQVAERAGVSVGSLYTYFNDRDTMLNFAVTLSARFLTEALDGFADDLAALPLREALGYYVAGGVEWSQTYAGLLRLFVRAAYQGDPGLSESLVRPVADSMRGVVGKILQAAQARGELRPDLDMEAAIRLVHGITIVVGDSQLLPHLNSYFQLADEAFAPERALAAMLQLICEGLGAREAQKDDD